MKQKELTSAPHYRSDHQGKMTCNLPASLLNIDMMADGPGKSAHDFGATRASFQKQGGQARRVPPCLKRTLMEQKYSHSACDAKMEDKVGDFKE